MLQTILSANGPACALSHVLVLTVCSFLTKTKTLMIFCNYTVSFVLTIPHINLEICPKLKTGVGVEIYVDQIGPDLTRA